jgi:hypothetical protein
LVIRRRLMNASWSGVGAANAGWSW